MKNEYFQLDFRTEEQIVRGVSLANFSLRRKTLPELAAAASRFAKDYGDCSCSLWRWKDGKIVGNGVLGYTVNEFIQQHSET